MAQLSMPSSAGRGPGRPPAAKAADTRKRIVRAARSVFSECGYEAATFQEIAVRADLTRPAINHYFSSKQLLYREVVDQTNELVVTAAVERAQRETTLIGRLSAFVAGATQAASENPSSAAFLMIAVLESQRHPELRGVEHDSVHSTREFLAWALDDAIERGELTTETDRASLTEMLVALLCGVGFYAGFVGGREQLDGITLQLQQLMAGRLWRLKA
jgi:TetR/AcrR family transcriptional regulator, repressor for uid operon